MKTPFYCKISVGKNLLSILQQTKKEHAYRPACLETETFPLKFLHIPNVPQKRA